MLDTKSLHFHQRASLPSDFITDVVRWAKDSGLSVYKRSSAIADSSVRYSFYNLGDIVLKVKALARKHKVNLCVTYYTQTNKKSLRAKIRYTLCLMLKK
jgi:hypothetical protein